MNVSNHNNKKRMYTFSFPFSSSTILSCRPPSITKPLFIPSHLFSHPSISALYRRRFIWFPFNLRLNLHDLFLSSLFDLEDQDESNPISKPSVCRVSHLSYTSFCLSSVVLCRSFSSVYLRTAEHPSPFPIQLGLFTKRKNVSVCVLWGVEVQILLWCWNVLWYVVETIEVEWRLRAL